jgi:hypothetical protein
MGEFEKGLLRKIFGSKSEEVTGGWKNWHNVSSSIVITVIK